MLSHFCLCRTGTAKPRRLPRMATIPAAALQWSHREAWLVGWLVKQTKHKVGPYDPDK